MKSCLIKIPFMANDVDIASGYLTGGLPSMTAIDGLVHLIERNFNKINGVDFSAKEWGFVIDNIQYDQGKSRYTGYEKSAKPEHFLNTPGREDKFATIKGFLIVNATHSDEVVLEQLRQNNKLIPIFNRLRLSGGTLWIDSARDEVNKQNLYKNKQKIKFFEYDDNEDCVDKYLELLKTSDSHSILIQDRTSLIAEKAPNSLEKTVEMFSYSVDQQSDADLDLKLFSSITEGVDDDELFLLNLELILSDYTKYLGSDFKNNSFKELVFSLDTKMKVDASKASKKAKDLLIPSFRSLDLKLTVMRNEFGLELTKEKFKELYKKIYKENSESGLNIVDEYIIPVNIGYHAISERKERNGMRFSKEKVEHIYAEPVLGMARPRKVCSVKVEALASQNISKFFWSNSKNENPNYSNKEYIVKAPIVNEQQCGDDNDFEYNF